MSKPHPTQTPRTLGENSTDESSSQITVGVPMFSREDALEQFLESVPAYVDEVIVADNGKAADRDVYYNEYAVDVHVLSLAYDSGIGACRAAIVDNCDSAYLWLGDCDMQFTRADDLRKLRAVLDANPDLGGVSGWLIEERGVRSGARNLKQSGDVVIKTTPPDVDICWEPYPHARFDFIPQAGLFRRECFETYSYDPTIESSEHFDFFYGHHDAGEWEFASCPAVAVEHHRQIDPDYRQSERGRNHVDWDRIKRKWGVSATAPGWRSDWGEQRSESLLEDGFSVFKRVTPPKIWLPLKRHAEAILHD